MHNGLAPVDGYFLLDSIGIIWKSVLDEMVVIIGYHWCLKMCFQECHCLSLVGKKSSLRIFGGASKETGAAVQCARSGGKDKQVSYKSNEHVKYML